MDYINLKYFRSTTDESYFEPASNDTCCSFCNQNDSPIIELDDTLSIITTSSESLTNVCLNCLYEKKYAFEQQAEGGYLIKDSILTESEKYPYLKKSSDYASDLLPKEQALLAMDKSKIDELKRTPPFRAWQGAIWLVHCNDFMTFVGTWEHEDFIKHSPDGKAQKFFEEICDNGDDLYESQFGPQKSAHAECTFYAFECIHCKQYRGYIDNA
ncbi:hypothetical protein BKI52_34720 [marine bacterium AO1-C]|nr:hypothetical protein BKI52_34720 [marine bacterium AO1-C]